MDRTRYASKGLSVSRSQAPRTILVAASVALIFFAAVFGMGFVKQQFFPSSDRAEVLIDVTLPQGGTIESTQATVAKLEKYLRTQPEAKIVSSYIGAGAPRFYLAYNPELPNPNFAKIIVLTQNEKARERLKLHLREQIIAGIAPEARVRVAQFVFGPYSPWPIAFRVSGPDPMQVRKYADQVLAVMKANPTRGRPTRIGTSERPTFTSFSTRHGCVLSGFRPVTLVSRFNSF